MFARLFPNHAHQFKWSTFFMTFLITLGQWCFGYPASIISTTLGEPAFLEYMKLIDPQTGKLTSTGLSLGGAANGVFFGGGAINVFITSWVSDRFGRRWTIRYNAVLGLFGGALCAGAPNIGTFIAGRFFTGMSAFGFISMTPVFSAELAPPALRGFFVGFNGFNIALGYSISAWIGAGSLFAQNPTVRWRVPLAIYLIFPLIMIGLMFVVPESPRWLFLNGRTEEARRVVDRLHRTRSHSNDEFVNAELYQMIKQTEIDRSLDNSWLGMFSRRYRKRTLLCCLLAFTGQSTAVLVINNYGPTFYAALGFSTEAQLFFTAGWVTTGWVGCWVGVLGLDRYGRRILILTAIGGCVICLSVVTAMVAQYSGTTNKGGQAAGVAFLFIFIFIYNIGLDVGASCYYAEAFPNHVRAKGVALANAALALADLVYLEVTPTAFAQIGWRFFLVFLVVASIGWVVLFFYLPETNGIPLEEMAKVFGDEDEIAVQIEQITPDMEQELNKDGVQIVKTDMGVSGDI